MKNRLDEFQAYRTRMNERISQIIVIPHLRHAVESLDLYRQNGTVKE